MSELGSYRNPELEVFIVKIHNCNMIKIIKNMLCITLALWSLYKDYARLICLSTRLRIHYNRTGQFWYEIKHTPNSDIGEDNYFYMENYHLK